VPMLIRVLLKIVVVQMKNLEPLQLDWELHYLLLLLDCLLVWDHDGGVEVDLGPGPVGAQQST
jgi:hypothetical protein